MNLGGYRCEDLGYDGGTLECNERCKFDPSKCGFCGDRRLDPWENCEEDLPLSDTCISLGYDGGKLRCIRCRFDISGCHLCGNGIIEGPEECDDGNKRDGDGCDSSCRIDLKCGNGIAEGFEECDKRDLKGETCESLGYEGGPLFCTRDCKFDISMCWICGNGRKDPNEECEGEDLGNHTCISLGFDRGRLFCKPNCEFNTNNCSKCGDRIIDRPWEECDQDNLDHQTCRSRGYLRGVLKCDQHCYFDESGCISAPKCGNGIIEEGEVCDRENLGGMTCMDLGYPGGVLACRLNCLEFDIRNCWQCGNGKREGDEECDLEDVGGETCESLGWGPGTLGCKSNCEFDFSGCSIIDKCGNGRIDPGEICDGENVGNTTCIDLGFLGGTLTCKPNCKEFDTSRCEEPRCGNRIIEGNEACDRDNFNHQTCRDFGFDGGFLVCKEDCSEILLDKCYNYGKCGDNKINQPEEECDGQDLGQHECRDFYPYDGGTLKCNPDCTFNFSQCYTTEKCGDGNIDPPGEECDGRDLGGYDCTNLPPPYKRWEGGNLGCTPQCKFDTSGCYRPVANCDPVSGYGCEKDEKCIFKLFTDGTRIWHELYCVQIGDILPGGLCDHDGECTLGAGCDWWDALPRRCYQYCYMDGSGPPCTPKNTVCVRIPPFPEGIGQCI
jgi:cysteine-rich repeat protein